MPIEVQEITNSATANLQFTRNTSTRVFKVRFTNDDGSALSDIDPRTVGFNTGVLLGQVHPSNALLKCTSFSSRREPSHPGVYEVTYNYEVDVLDPDGPDIDGGGNETFQQSVQLNYRGKFEKLWRVNANVNAEPYTGGSSGADIGGTPMDTFGEIERTTMIVKPQLQVTIQRNVNIGRPNNYLSNLQNFVGTRNKSTFLGAREGSLLYVGASSRRVRDQLYEITHTFEFDQAKHQEQAPQPGAGMFGKKIQTADGDYKNRAFPVYWIQPYPRELDFNVLGINLRG